MTLHAHRDDRRTLCGLAMPSPRVESTAAVADFDQQIQVTCPACRLELDWVWSDRHRAAAVGPLRGHQKRAADRRATLLQMLRHPMTAGQVAARLGVSKVMAWRLLNEIRQLGQVIGEGGRGEVVYRRAPAAGGDQ